ncbi:MFS transporter [Dietzia lutea]|uniref:MFS transporter n=1 Tax=Dietzia lutea TaxID=546160 RepID=A0A2S1RAE5_9ACTN|nr:MFS transporter [Dietzia lutea]AWH93201.1 MFS transporter [Dietzia lutea]
MTSTSVPDDAARTADVRGPIAATALLFAANGAIFGAIVPRLPDLKSALDLGAGEFGLAMACYPAGALVGGLLTPALMRRRSDGAVAVTMMVGASVAAALVGFSPVVAVFAALLLVFGVCDAITDVSMNAHGIRVQLRHGRSLINRFHALWSLGAVLGAAGGSVAAGAGASVRIQMIGAAVVCALAAVAAYPMRLGPAAAEDERGRDLDTVLDDTALADPGPRDAGSRAAAGRRLPGGRALLLLIALGLFACCAELVEDFAQTWSALYLRETTIAGAGLAGLGFIAVQGAQLAGRVSGDALVERFGAARLGRAGGLFVMVGAGAAFVASFTLGGPALLAVLLIGFVLAGWGIATVIPGAMVGADSVPGLAPGAGLAVLNWVMRLGFLASPPLVGLIAEVAGLRWTVTPMIVGGVLIAALAGPLLGRADRTPDDRTPADRAPAREKETMT